MSTFAPRTVTCPRCGEASEQMVATTLNPSRSPAKRDAILNGTFQLMTCEACGQRYTYTGKFSYVDFSARLLIGVLPVAAERQWAEHELAVARMFDRDLGRGAPRIAREIGEGFRVRLVFGLAALREKLVVFDADLDDRVVEAAKLALMRDAETIDLSWEQRPQLIEVDHREAIFTVLPPPGRPRPSVLRFAVARAWLDDLSGENSVMEAIELVGAGPYVDCGRVLHSPSSRAYSRGSAAS